MNISNPTTYLLSIKIHVFHFGLSDLITGIYFYIDVAVCQWAGRIVLYTNLKNLMSKILENSLLYIRLDQCVIYLIERAWGEKGRKQQHLFFIFFFRRLWEVLILIIRETWKLYENSHCLHLQRQQVPFLYFSSFCFWWYYTNNTMPSCFLALMT